MKSQDRTISLRPRGVNAFPSSYDLLLFCLAYRMALLLTVLRRASSKSKLLNTRYATLSTMAETNRLKDAKSPYLLQHKDNPVHWFEWSEAAFTKAKQEEKPVLLSVGYAA